MNSSTSLQRILGGAHLNVTESPLIAFGEGELNTAPIPTIVRSLRRRLRLRARLGFVSPLSSRFRLPSSRASPDETGRSIEAAMALAAAAHKIPLEVAHTLVEIAEVARYAYEHRPGHSPAHDGAGPPPAEAADEGEAARLQAENAILRARLADDLALLRELQGVPCVSQECPPDLHNRLVAAVNNASFLAHLEKVRGESLCQHTEVSSGNKTEVEVGDIPYANGDGKNGSWVLVACDNAGGNLEEISGIDNENYVMVNDDDIVDAIATFIARCILEDPKSKSLSQAELQKAVAIALSTMKDRKKWISFWEAGKVIYILATWGITLVGLYRSRTVLKMAAKGTAVSAKFVMKAL